MDTNRDKPSMDKKRSNIYTVIFVVICAIILIFLLNAPPETTKKLPYDEIHKKFYPMTKKEAERHCQKCHDKDKVAPLPEGHPPKYRCLFCHKKEVPTKK